MVLAIENIQREAPALPEGIVLEQLFLDFRKDKAALNIQPTSWLPGVLANFDLLAPDQESAIFKRFEQFELAEKYILAFTEQNTHKQQQRSETLFKVYEGNDGQANRDIAFLIEDSQQVKPIISRVRRSFALQHYANSVRDFIDLQVGDENSPWHAMFTQVITGSFLVEAQQEARKKPPSNYIKGMRALKVEALVDEVIVKQTWEAPETVRELALGLMVQTMMAMQNSGVGTGEIHELMTNESVADKLFGLTTLAVSREGWVGGGANKENQVPNGLVSEGMVEPTHSELIQFYRDNMSVSGSWTELLKKLTSLDQLSPEEREVVLTRIYLVDSKLHELLDGRISAIGLDNPSFVPHMTEVKARAIKEIMSRFDMLLEHAMLGAKIDWLRSVDTVVIEEALARSLHEVVEQVYRANAPRETDRQLGSRTIFSRVVNQVKVLARRGLGRLELPKKSSQEMLIARLAIVVSGLEGTVLGYVAWVSAVSNILK